MQNYKFFLFILICFIIVLLSPVVTYSDSEENRPGINLDKCFFDFPINIKTFQNSVFYPLCDENLFDSYYWDVPSNYFGNYYSFMNGFHPGEDWNLVGGNSYADNGAPVYSIAEGIIKKISRLGDLGYLVGVEHNTSPDLPFVIPAKSSYENGQYYFYPEEEVTKFYSIYLHIDNLPENILDGEINSYHVSKGELIGYIMDSGSGPHLHFEIRHPNASHSNNWSMVGNSNNWAIKSGSYTGYYLNVQEMINAGMREPRSFIAANNNSWDFNTIYNNNDTEFWTLNNIDSYSVHNNIFYLDPSSIDPYIISPDLLLKSSEYDLIRIKIASNAPDGNGCIYFTTDQYPNFSEDKKISFQIINDGSYREYEIITKNHILWTGKITKIRIDPCSNGINGTNQDTIGIDYVKLSNNNQINPTLSGSTNLNGPWETHISGEQGTTFYFQGSGYTPNTIAIQHIIYPNGNESIYDIGVDSAGEIFWSYNSTCDDEIGQYTIWITDFNGINSNNLYENIEFNINCNNPPSVPTSPSGPSEGTINTSYSFSTSSSDPDGDSIEYRFDWGDGQISSWGIATQSHMWNSNGSFTIKAQARDEHGAVSSWSSGTILTISTIHEVTTPVCPSGETNGYTNTTYSFNTTGASCSEGHAVEYRFDWGDGNYSNWSISESAAHSWSMSGSYLVRAQARCSVEQDILSEWSDGLSVTITEEIIEYSLTISATVGGTTQPSPGTYSYNVGEHIEIQAIPNDFFDFSHWSGDINDVQNPISIKMDSDKSITANFTQGGPIEFISSIDTPNYARGVKVSGNYAYIADGESGLRIIDITDTDNPNEISSYNTPGDAKKVTLSGSYAYIADYTSGLRIINISTPSNPIESGYYDSPGDARDVYVNETYAYLADGYSGLRIINISDPSNPYEIGFFDTQGSAYGIDVKDQIAYVADFTGGLRIIDCSDPNNPEEIGSFITSNVIKDISIYDFKAYIACDTDGIKIVDIENPAATAELGFYSNNSFSNALRKTGSFVYIADGGKGLRILDVHSSSDPFLLAAYDTSGHTFDVDTKDNYIYVADGIEGLKILRYIPPHTVETPIKPNGPSNGIENSEYSFSTQEDSCSLWHALEYQFDWGDGSYSSWLSSPASTHFWSNSGVYNIRVRARCLVETDILSGWSESSAITIESSGIYYDLNLFTTSGGTTIPSPGTYSYEENNQVEIEANPYQGYIFSHWAGNVSAEKSNDNPLVITMDSDKSLTANFTSCQIPAEPTNPNPIHNATSVSINTNLDWSDCSGAEEYDVYFGTDANPGFYVNTSESTYDIPVLNNNTTYYWKITAKNACGNIEGPIWQFTTSSSQGMYSSPSHYQVIPEVFWAPSSGGGTWTTNVQITDATGGSQVSIYFNSISGERRGPFLLNTMNVDTSIKINNILELINEVDSGFDYYGTVGAMEFFTQDETHKIQVIARTKNGNYSKTFQGLNLNDDNTANTDRIMMIQNLSSNELFRSSYGGFNPSDEPISVRYELIDKTGALVGSSFTKTFSPKQFIAFFPFKEAGIDYPEQSFSNTWLKIIPTTGNGEIISYGATVNNLTNDPAAHTAIQFSDISGYNSPSNHQIIPEVMWAPASFGGTWMTEIQVVDMSGGSELWLTFYAHTGEKRGPFNLGSFSSQYSSGSAKNILAILNNIDSGYNYSGKVGAIEFMTQDSHHKIQVMARTYNGNFSKTIQGLNHNAANTANQERVMMIQNLKSDADYRSTFGGFNPTSETITVEFTLLDENGNISGQVFTKNFPGGSFKAFFPFKEAGISYPALSSDNVWLKIEVISGTGELMIYGSTTNNHTNDPAYHRGIQYR
jgi:murein DD-endopeptidase MepM/ murein hydrolase activator NlpD